MIIRLAGLIGRIESLLDLILLNEYGLAGLDLKNILRQCLPSGYITCGLELNGSSLV